MSKKFILLPVLLGLLITTSYGQNYLNEVKGISSFAKLIKEIHGKTASVTVDNNTGEINIPDDLDKLLQGIALKANGLLKSTAPPLKDEFGDSNEPPAATVAVPAEGAIVPAAPGARARARVADPAAPAPPPVSDNVSLLESRIKATQAKGGDVYMELKFLSFLVYNNTSADYNNSKIQASFPQHFTHLQAIIRAMEEYAKTLQSDSEGIGQSNKEGSSSFAFSESAIILGITDWAIRRAKEELITVYLNDWYEKLKANELISPLIPQSLKVYEAFKEDNAINLAKYGDKWKAAFQEDIRNIPVVLQKEVYVGLILTKLGLNSTDALYKELLPVVTGGNEIAYNLYLKKHLVVVLSNMAARYSTGTDLASLPVFKRAVMMADLLARVCGEMNENHYNAFPLEDIRKMKAESWRFLFKLVLVRDNKALTAIFNNNADQFVADVIFNNQDSKIGQVSQLVQETVTVISSYQNILSNIKSQQSEISFDDVRKLFDLFAQLTDNVSGYLEVIGGNNMNTIVTGYKDNVKPFISYLSEIGEGVSTKQYGKVLDGAASILRKVDELNNPGTATLADVITYIQRYGSFMLNILSAKDAGEVETALDELIPKGQYQLKNQKNFSVSISVYPGVFGGIERIRKYQTDNNGNALTALPKVSSSKTSLSLYLPIGIDFNFGGELKCKKPKKTKYYSSHSIFLQAFDLGSALNYRLTGSDDSTESSNPDITFKQLFSPGINYMYHFANSPVVLGAGLNYAPELRKIEQGGNTYNANALRYGIFVAVDVTALFLYISKH